MISKEIENCIVKYFSQSANITDLDLLNDWISVEENQTTFKTYVKTHFAINLAMNDPDLENIKEKLLKEIRRANNHTAIRYLPYLKYAAVAILFLGLGFLWKSNVNENTPIRQIVPRVDAITLELEDGTLEIIHENGTKNVLNSKGEVIGVQKGKTLVYGKNVSESVLAYNTINVPNGKKFNLVLSDGSEVHLNSGSSLKYPMKFNKDLKRQVYLYGEAYFEVTHDKEHPFVVNSDELDVLVYGTKFNVSNYPEDPDTEVVLVEGSVSLTEINKIGKEKEEFFLMPGYKGSFNKSNKSIIDEKVNTALYTSWMNGNLVFRNTPFDVITQKLERHYNVKIINNNAKLGHEKFNATIEINNETIEQVFSYFNKVYQIEFEIMENNIIIN
tara:strand:+ start:1590 stop:2750 length:1161 start_codon:yes stop_codon:yes gene_type:complete